MSIDTINKNLLGLRISENINTSMGVDNNLISSKTRLLADALATEIQSISDITDEAMSRFRTATAEAGYLDINGAEHGIYRNRTPYVSIDKDNIAKILPVSGPDGFDDLIIGKQIIEAGESFRMAGPYLVTFLKPVIITSKFSTPEASIRIEPIDTTVSVQINKNTVFEMTGEDNPYLDYILIKIYADLTAPFLPVSDDDFRIAIEKSKRTPYTSTQEAVGITMSMIKNINGYVLSGVENGGASIAIYVVTNDMIANGSDNKIATIEAFTRGRLREVIPAGINIDFIFPEKLNLRLKVKRNNIAATDQLIKEAVVEFVKSNYQYAEQQIFDTSSMTSLLKAQYKSLSGIEITDVGTFDVLLNSSIHEYDTILQLDKLTYVTIGTSDIEVY